MKFWEADSELHFISIIVFWNSPWPFGLKQPLHGGLIYFVTGIDVIPVVLIIIGS